METKTDISKFLSNYKKTVEKIEGVSTDNSPPAWWLSSGNYVLNYLSSGNFDSFIPQGRISGIFGASAAGKSFLVNTIIKTALDNGFICVPLDSERAWDDNAARKIGIDPDNPLYFPLKVSSIETCQKTISKFLKDYKDEYGDLSIDEQPKTLIVIDSVDGLSTENELGKFDKGDTYSDQGQLAKQQKAMMKPWIDAIGGLSVAIVFTKQVYPNTLDNVKAGKGVWAITESIKYWASQCILLSKLQLRDEKDKTNILGIRMKCEMHKTRFSKPFQTVSIDVPYETGIDKWSGFTDMAKSMGVIRSAGAWNYYTLNGEEIKFQNSSFEKHSENILNLCKEKYGTFLKLSEADLELEVIE